MKHFRYPVETGLLLALCFFLPLLEAPKNLIWAAYVATWIVNRARTRDFGGRWDLWDTLIAAWIASGFLVAAFAGLDGGQWGGALDLLRYASLLWLVKRAGYDRREIRWLLAALVVSTMVGLAIGHWRLWSGRLKFGLELHSVGHVNHTAIYLALVLGLCTAWVFARWHAWRIGTRAVMLLVTALVLASLVETASRGAIGVGLAVLPLLAAAWWPRSRIPMAISAAVVAVVIAVAVLGGAEAVRKHLTNAKADNVLAFRDGIWRVGVAAWLRYPWFGVGMNNYSRITEDRVRAWDADAGRTVDPKRYYFISHGHSVYVNTLAERGLVGISMLAMVLIAWAAFLARYRPRPDDPDEEWLLWGGAAGAWIITTGAGVVNTTLHHEHGMLAALLLGLWLSRLPTSTARLPLPAARIR
jgi:O-antigen ligase